MSPELRRWGWKKGESGNPSGKTALPAEIRIERKKNQANLIRLVMATFARTKGQQQAYVKRNNMTNLERAVDGMIAKAAKGNAKAFQYMIELICGKIPEVDVDSHTEDMTPGEKLEMLKQAVLIMETQAKNGSGPAQ